MMKLLVATALLLCVVADAYHNSEHKLLGPLFGVNRNHVYDVTLEVSSSIAGISAQASRSILRADLFINSKPRGEHLLKLKNVRVSGSLKGVSSHEANVDLRPNKELEDHLSIPIKFTLENGKVTSYTLDKQETVETKKIKRAILRLIEVHVDKDEVARIQPGSHVDLPITYNVTRDTPVGQYQSHYIITVSPYPNFPYNRNVFNISRSDNYEGIRYPSHVFHHNFEQQGCAEVCKKDWSDNKYGAGCPAGHEPHQSIIKLYYNHHHNLVLEQKVMVPEMITAVETHVANTYDQDMRVYISSTMIKKRSNGEEIDEPQGQEKYTDLHDMENKNSEKEINEFCGYESPRKAVETAKNLLKELAEIVVKANLEEEKNTLIGEKLILLQKALGMLTENDLESLERIIPKLGTLEQSSDIDRARRQIWMDILTLIGTEESISYISKYLRNKVPSEVTVWEAKEILEALPANIHNATERTIRDLMSIWESNVVSRYHIYHSAAHLSVARIISRICGDVRRSEKEQEPSSWMDGYSQVLQTLQLSRSDESSSFRCPTKLVDEIVERVSQKLSSSSHRQEKAVYIETLAHISTIKSIERLAKYAYGVSEDMEAYSPGQISFFRTIAIYALHNTVRKYPQKALRIVVPIYFNKTEEPKLRTAAFGIILRSQPSLALLYHIAIDTWNEPSREVGSHVTSSFETFGNSSMPCYQLTALRIKKVISQAKRFDIGSQHAKNVLLSYFDDIREFGLEQRFEYTPSNASYIPSTIYQALSYSSDSLKDTLFQLALNIQGLTQKRVMEILRDVANIKMGKAIPSKMEREIFGKAKVGDRVPEAFKMTWFNRIFYSTSYYYFQNLEQDLAPLRTHLKKYFMTSSGVKGIHVKLFMPSSHHTRAIGKTLSFPVEFSMKHPLLLAVQVKALRTEKGAAKNIRFAMNLSYYLTKIYTHHIKVLRDCKETGSYYEQKFGLDLPLEVKIAYDHFGKMKFQYKITELPKSVFTVWSEAGTYAGKRNLETLPHMKEREPIRTVPEQFKREHEVSIVGLPKIHISIHTDNMAEGTEEIPRNIQEALHWVVTRAQHAGWRRRSLNVTLNTDSKFWPVDTEVTVKFDYEKNHMAPGHDHMVRAQQVESDNDNEWSPLQGTEERKTEEDLVKEMGITDDIDSKDKPKFLVNGQKIYKTLISSWPHMSHILDIQVETTPISNTASLRVEYNHTHGRHLHVIHMDAAINMKRIPIPFEISADYMIGFNFVPSQFKYDENMAKLMRGRFLSTISLHNARPFENVDVSIAGTMRRKPMSEILKDVLVNDVDEKHFLPEKHYECLKHTQSGRALSEECIRSIREISTFNNYKAVVMWSETKLPSVLRTLAKRIELATRVAGFSHLEIQEKKHVKNSVDIELTHIDKWIDEPVVDIVLEKPTQTVKYSKVSPGFVQPISSIHTLPYTYIQAVTNYTYPATCDVMEKYLTTYDRKTFEIPAHECQYIVSAHCTKYKQFAVLAKIISARTGTKEITIYVADQKLILHPEDSEGYKIHFNGQQKIVKILNPLMLGDEDTPITVVKNTAVGQTYLIVEAHLIGLKVIYDGKNVRIQVHPRYKGELCGLCSEFNGEISREYRAPDLCLYSSAEDFVKRSIVDPEACHVDAEPSKRRICPSGEHQTDLADDARQVQRNVVKYKNHGTQVCFSVTPVSVCEDDATPIRKEARSVGYHCLPSDDKTAMKLVEEAKVKVLDVMRGKTVDFTENVEVAEEC